ncbi:MAG: ERCC4 domain-containing protein [Oscillospiraceae bacterium]|nr:ERCC4 domain-containing protein [Oscillospiraceae bacterium]
MRIIRDTREQNPYLFRGYPVELTAGTLNTGDYSVPGFCDAVAVERKELGDLLGCLTHDRDRFTRELERLRGYQSAALLVEASYTTISAGAYRSRMTPDAAVQSLVSIMQQYRMPVFFAENRSAGERFIYDFLRHFTRHALQRYKAITAAGDTQTQTEAGRHE